MRRRTSRIREVVRSDRLADELLAVDLAPISAQPPGVGVGLEENCEQQPPGNLQDVQRNGLVARIAEIRGTQCWEVRDVLGQGPVDEADVVEPSYVPVRHLDCNAVVPSLLTSPVNLPHDLLGSPPVGVMSSEPIDDTDVGW